MKKIASFVPPIVGDEWEALWREYEAAETPEAKAVKQVPISGDANIENSNPQF